MIRGDVGDQRVNIAQAPSLFRLAFLSLICSTIIQSVQCKRELSVRVVTDLDQSYGHRVTYRSPLTPFWYYAVTVIYWTRAESGYLK